MSPVCTRHILYDPLPSLTCIALTVFWDQPTLQYIFDGNTSYPASYDVIEIPTEGTVSSGTIRRSVITLTEY